ncbi:MAG: hypothetical protein LBQ19_03840 [Synergistaceae bacterium]|jgi:hypothetical protein|nr:hypothetical protein [Synergistaceae bacterium]
MKKTLLCIAAILAAMTVAGAEAATPYSYRFDDISGPSGRGAQWIVVTRSNDSRGAPIGGERGEVIRTNADIVNSRDHVYISGTSGTQGATLEDEPILYVFLAFPNFSVSPSVEFSLRNQGQAIPYTQDVTIAGDSYRVERTSLPDSTGSSGSYRFDLFKSIREDRYGTERLYMSFHQNPDYTPSQTLVIPLILANVADGSAARNPLLIKATMRDNNDNIVAYDRFTWGVAENIEVGGQNDWIFVPLENSDINANPVSYNLTTDITNYSGIRYALDRYDLLSQRETLFPSAWALDLPPEVTDIPSVVSLDGLSHVPPGFITTYNQSFDVVSGRKNIFSMYSVDPAGIPYDMVLAHPPIFGVKRGEKSGTDYFVSGFELLPSDTEFLRKAADALGGREAKIFSGDVSGSIDGVFATADAVSAIKVNAAMPEGLLRSNDVTGLLPLHVTFNMPNGHRFISPRWNALVTEWKNSGQARDIFSRYYSLYSYDSSGRKTDLFEWLRNRGAFEKVVKVFIDEARQRVSLSFIVMLTDKDSQRFDILRDSSVISQNSFDYLVIGDSNANDYWDMTFFVAPLEEALDEDGDGTGGGSGKGDSGGGGGCSSAGFSVFALTVAGAALAIRKKRRADGA